MNLAEHQQHDLDSRILANIALVSGADSAFSYSTENPEKDPQMHGINSHFIHVNGPTSDTPFTELPLQRFILLDI